MPRIMLAILVVLAIPPATARADRAGAFAYYVLALSWSPNWCARIGDARQAEQCAPGAGHGWVLHGLWPQHAHGWPAYCATAARPPTGAMTASMADIMGSPDLAWHQWKKHGTCSGLAAGDYFALSRAAYAAVTRPAVFRRLQAPAILPARVVEEAFLKANPQLVPNMITITCRDGRIHEARLCLDKDLSPRPCGADVRRDCRAGDALFAPLR